MSLQVAYRAALIAGVTAVLVLGACGDDFGGFPSSTGNGSGGGDGGAGVGGTGDGGTGNGSGGMGNAPPGNVPCGDPAVPDTIPCPSVCNGGCNDGRCVILCQGDQACNSVVNCPPGLDCEVTCSGVDSCRLEVNCPDYYQCNVGCTAPGSCTGATINCGDIGNCGVTCALADACAGANINCAGGKCSTLCIGMGMPNISCNDSCDCADCS